jgi:hypothetical protein
MFVRFAIRFREINGGGDVKVMLEAGYMETNRLSGLI